MLAVLALAVGAAGCGSGSSSTGATTAATTNAPARQTGTPKSAPASPGGESSPGSSITGYGAAAQGSGRAAVTAAAHSFFIAMATHDYAKVCAGLAASNREQLAAFAEGRRPGGCEVALKALLDPAAATEARRAADAPVTSVRIKAGTAFVLFRPKDGVPSYFVMKEEGGAWKAIGLAPGTPIDPTATP